MAKHFAELTRTVVDKCVFESTDCQTGNKIEEYSVPMTLTAGVRVFKTAVAAKHWVQVINDAHGEGTALLGRPA